MDNKKIFFDVLKQELSPELRKIGFKGSGQNFQRVESEVINIVNIQSYKYGGSCAVNLGLHLSFLPLSWNMELPDLKKIKEYECEFRARLAPSNRSDYWWKYDGVLGSTEKKARHLIQSYFKYGEPQFNKFDSIEKISTMFTIGDFNKKDWLTVFGDITLQRGVLTLARIHLYLGNMAKAREFATFGIENLGKATVLRPQYQGVLDATQSTNISI